VRLPDARLDEVAELLVAAAATLGGAT